MDGDHLINHSFYFREANYRMSLKIEASRDRIGSTTRYYANKLLS